MTNGKQLVIVQDVAGKSIVPTNVQLIKERHKKSGTKRPAQKDRHESLRLTKVFGTKGFGTKGFG